MPLAETRAALAASQEALVRVLSGQGDAPNGFDGDRLRAAADALLNKRLRSVAHACPALSGTLGDRFEPLFRAFAGTRLIPRRGGPLADGRAFAGALAATGDLPEAARLEAMAIDLRWARRPDGLVPRRGPAVRLTWLRQARRLVVAVRIPWVGEWWVG
jgi:hypothetical protein